MNHYQEAAVTLHQHPELQLQKQPMEGGKGEEKLQGETGRNMGNMKKRKKQERHIKGKPDVHLPVHGITDRSVDLTLPVKGTGPVQEIFLIFQSIILAFFQNNRLNIKNIKFNKRLEILDNSTIMRINNLRKEDGGIYSVTVHYTDIEQYNASYILTVYDPVASPKIQRQRNDNNLCNVTLHCSVPSNISDLSYIWKSRNQNATYQPYSNGSTIQISVPPDHQDMEFLCIVQNPADQKNVSIHVRHVCSYLDTFRKSKDEGRHYHLLLLFPLAALVIFGWFLFKRYNKKKSAKKTREGNAINQYRPGRV
ncbi:SLAM family member 5-like [Anomaloglossus baeobatrachus]